MHVMGVIASYREMFGIGRGLRILTCPAVLPRLGGADLFVIAVHVVVKEANDGGLG